MQPAMQYLFKSSNKLHNLFIRVYILRSKQLSNLVSLRLLQKFIYIYLWIMRFCLCNLHINFNLLFFLQFRILLVYGSNEMCYILSTVHIFIEWSLPKLPISLLKLYRPAELYELFDWNLIWRSMLFVLYNWVFLKFILDVSTMSISLSRMLNN
jgi:hypothetical protein